MKIWEFVRIVQNSVYIKQRPTLIVLASSLHISILEHDFWGGVMVWNPHDSPHRMCSTEKCLFGTIPMSSLGFEPVTSRTESREPDPLQQRRKMLE